LIARTPCLCRHPRISLSGRYANWLGFPHQQTIFDDPALHIAAHTSRAGWLKQHLRPNKTVFHPTAGDPGHKISHSDAVTGLMRLKRSNASPCASWSIDNQRIGANMQMSALATICLMSTKIDRFGFGLVGLQEETGEARYRIGRRHHSATTP
jgi:hypothetical protein